MISESLIIEKIVEANKNDKLALFVGAGVSKSSDTDKDKMPSWDTLIDNIKNRIKEEDKTDFLKIAQYFYNTVSEEEYYKTIEDMFPISISPSNVHKRIFDINPHIIITTNWDSLLEDTNQKYACFYDTVSNNRELVRSVFHHKIVKMHGDFAHNNIVFKEEDYLEYENNFPLISNYIKSILSTHTVLFLGYSYNDINLKLIIQWLRNKAELRPDMFLATCYTESNQIEYLKKQGIGTYFLSNINNKLNGINNMDMDSKMIYTFLDKIHKGYDPQAIEKTDDKIQFIYKKLKLLDSLNIILIDQIQKILTNCGYIFDNDHYAVLQFYNKLLTGDYNDGIRDIYIKFIEILNYTVNGEKPSNLLLEIFSILIKAGIKGIMLEKDEFSDEKQTYITLNSFLTQEINILKSCNFDFSFTNYIPDSDNVDVLFESAFNLYNLKKTEEAYNLTEKIIEITVSTNNYVKLFIAIFNRDTLLRILKYQSTSSDRNKYKNIEEYNIKSHYNNLTRQLKIEIKSIYDFLNFSYIYKYLNSSIDDLEKMRKHKQTIEDGGLVYSSDIYRFSGKHFNLLNFVLSNKIMIENFPEYEKININYIEIALMRQTQNKNTTLSRPEIFACIKYFDSNDLKNLFHEYYEEGSTKIGTFDLDSDDKNWLINTVLMNCVELYLVEDDTFYATFDLYIENILFVLSLVHLQVFIEPYIKDDFFDSFFYGMNNQIDYMVNKLNIKELEDVSLQIKEIIKNYQRSERQSIF